MSRLYAFNSLAGCSRSATSVVEVSTAGTFDSANLGNSISIPNGVEVFDTMPFIDGSASVTTLYHRFDFQGTGNGAPIDSDWIGFVNSTGTIVAKVNTVSGNVRLSFWNGGSYTFTDFAVSMNVSSGRRTYMIKIVCGASGSLTFYQGGVPLCTIPITSANCNNVATVRHRAPGQGVGGGSTAYYSKIIGADYDIKDVELAGTALNGNSATNTSGTGAYTDLNELALDDSTAINIAAAGKKGFTKPAVTVPAGYAIIGGVINARGRISGGVVTQAKHGWRSSASEVSSTDRAYGAAYGPRGAIQLTDPNGGAQFNQTTYNAAEIYLEAA